MRGAEQCAGRLASESGDLTEVTHMQSVPKLVNYLLLHKNKENLIVKTLLKLNIKEVPLQMKN